MVDPLDPIATICSYARDLYIRNLAARKLYRLSAKLEGMNDDRMTLIARIIVYLAEEIEYESATIYTTQCKEKVKTVLEELKKLDKTEEKEEDENYDIYSA